MTQKNDESLPPTETATNSADGVVVHRFSKPVTFEGQEIEELRMYLDGLTGRDISQVKSQWAAAGNFSPMAAADMTFCIMLACKAAKQPLELADVLPAKEYVKVQQEVSNFLLN